MTRPSSPDRRGCRGVRRSTVRDGASRYAELLATAGIERGLIGPREADRIWERHLFNCAALAPLIPPDATVDRSWVAVPVCPGIPLALARPDLQ